MGKLEVVCTWGDGPDVLVVGNGHPAVLLEEPLKKDKGVYGQSDYYSISLTAAECRKLIRGLQAALATVVTLEDGLAAYLDGEKDEEGNSEAND